MTFILGSILFLLGGFFGMLIMSFMYAMNATMKREREVNYFKGLINE